MDSLIRRDSYWFVEGEGDEARMAALCEICAKKHDKGWYWNGGQGYGDYDLFCSNCNNAIHIRGKNETEAGHQNGGQQEPPGSLDNRAVPRKLPGNDLY